MENRNDKTRKSKRERERQRKRQTRDRDVLDVMDAKLAKSVEIISSCQLLEK